MILLLLQSFTDNNVLAVNKMPNLVYHSIYYISIIPLRILSRVYINNGFRDLTILVKAIHFELCMQTCEKLERSRGLYAPNGNDDLEAWVDYVQLYAGSPTQAYWTSTEFEGGNWKDYYTGQFFALDKVTLKLCTFDTRQLMKQNIPK